MKRLVLWGMDELECGTCDQPVYTINSPPNWKANTMPGLLMLLKTGSLSGEMGGGGGLWQGDRLWLGLSRGASGV